MNIIFLGSGAFGLPALNALLASHHKILHIISQPDRPAGRGSHLTPTPVSDFATTHHLPLTRTDNANTLLDTLAPLHPDVFVVIAFGQKLSDEFLSLAPHGGINLHSSLLPKYRGAAPINWALINNDPITGACVIRVTSKMDAGDILASASTPITDTETAGELHDRLAVLGAPLIPQVLDQLAAGTVHPIAQDHTQKSPAPKLSRELSWIDFSQPSGLVSARIRGLSPWPGCNAQYTDPAGKPRITATLVKVQATPSTATHPAERQGTVLPDKSIACATGSIQLLSVQPQGKKPMDSAAFANGYGLAPGGRFTSIVPRPQR